jgi:hypothetical protein
MPATPGQVRANHECRYGAALEPASAGTEEDDTLDNDVLRTREALRQTKGLHATNCRDAVLHEAVIDQIARDERRIELRGKLRVAFDLGGLQPFNEFLGITRERIRLPASSGDGASTQAGAGKSGTAQVLTKGSTLRSRHRSWLA